jgi:hypothetical protein
MGAVVVELYGCRVALLFLILSPHCLFVGTRMLFHRSPGIDSMTCRPLPLPALRLQGGLSVLIVFRVVCGGDVGRGSWSRSASGWALCLLHRPGRWVRWGGPGGLGGVLQSAVMWGGVGRRGLGCSRHLCGEYLGWGCCLGI